MSCTHRQFSKADDYDMACQWWDMHGWPKMDAEMLSDFGFMVLSDGTPTCTGSFYLTSSKWIVLEFIVVNPTVPIRRRAEALQYFLHLVVKEAKELGMKSIFSSIKPGGLVKLYERAGFVQTDRGMTNMVARLWP